MKQIKRNLKTAEQHVTNAIRLATKTNHVIFHNNELLKELATFKRTPEMKEKIKQLKQQNKSLIEWSQSTDQWVIDQQNKINFVKNEIMPKEENEVVSCES